MLVFSAIIPHSPLLIPIINKNSEDKLKKTKQAIEKIVHNFYSAQPETIIIFSPHSKLMKNSFTVNISDKFYSSFKKFGDLETAETYQGDIAFAYQIKEFLEAKEPLQIINYPELDYGISIPLYFLLKEKKDVKIIPFGHSSLDLKRHFELGKKISEIIHQSNKRIAILASSDLSHNSNETSSADSYKNRKKFDKQLIELIEKKDNDGILKFNPNFIENANQCGLESIVILLGILNEQNYTPKISSYESPFGVGYLVSNFELNK